LPIAPKDFATLVGTIIALPNTASVAELLGNRALEDMVWTTPGAEIAHRNAGRDRRCAEQRSTRRQHGMVARAGHGCGDRDRTADQATGGAS
jgi:hypothetical protein